ncbi:MAG: hypothetical protein QNI90_04465 [Dinoroseobacter sp.]|nr:hypothetical protein [Dinoroseobacter sp.]
MNQLNRKLRFSDVSRGIDLSQKAFRNWLQRYDLSLLSNHKTRDWTDFTVADVAVLALTRELVRWGIGVEEANETAFIALKRTIGSLLQYRNTPAEAMLAILHQRLIYVCKPISAEETKVIFDAESSKIKPSDYDSVLCLNLEITVTRAFLRCGALKEEYELPRTLTQTEA